MITNEQEKIEFCKKNHNKPFNIAMKENFVDTHGGNLALKKGNPYRITIAKYDSHPDGKLAISCVLEKCRANQENVKFEGAHEYFEHQFKIFTSRFDII